MKNPIVEIRDKKDKNTVFFKDGLYQIMTHLLYQDGIILLPPSKIEIRIYLNGEEIDKPLEFEDEEDKEGG